MKGWLTCLIVVTPFFSLALPAKPSVLSETTELSKTRLSNLTSSKFLPTEPNFPAIDVGPPMPLSKLERKPVAVNSPSLSFPLSPLSSLNSIATSSIKISASPLVSSSPHIMTSIPPLSSADFTRISDMDIAPNPILSLSMSVPISLILDSELMIDLAIAGVGRARLISAKVTVISSSLL